MADAADKKNIVKMAYIYFQEGRWDKAIEEYKKLITLDPEDVNTHNMLGDVYVKKGDVRAAYGEYSKVASDYSARGLTDKIQIVNKKIAALDPTALPPEGKQKQSLIRQTVKAEAAMEQGDEDGAIEALSEVLKLDPESLGAYARLGELFEKKGKIPEAVQQYSNLGNAYLKNRMYRKAQEMFQKAVQLDPNNIDGRVNLAQIFIKQGSESDAKKEYLVIAELCLNNGDLEKAQVNAAKAIELKSIEAHFILGIVYYQKKQFSEAKTQFESLLRFKVNHVGALVNLGLVLMEQNQLDKAAENIQKALKAEKDNLSALEAWADICLKKGSKTESVTTLMTLADRYLAKDDLKKAVELARNASAIDDESIPAHTKLGELLVKSGDKSKAADSFFKAGTLFEKQNKKDRALELFKKANEADPGHANAREKTGGESAHASPAAEHEAKTHKSPEPGGKLSGAGVMDLEQEAPTASLHKPKGPAAPSPAEIERAPVAETDPMEEMKAQMAIADSYVKQGLVEEAIEIYQQLTETYPQDAALKAKLNQVYTAYVKTGDDVIGALEAEKKVKEEEERHLRAEMEQKALAEAKKMRAELEMKARVEAEEKARGELERKAQAEAEHKAKEEMEHRVRAEVMKKLEEEKRTREQAEHKAKEEAERRMREELQKSLTPKEPPSLKAAPSPVGSSPRNETAADGKPDEFATIAVADIYTRTGLHDEALKIYKRIVQMEPENLEARKKLKETEDLIKSKSSKSSPSPFPSPEYPPQNVEAPPPHNPSPSAEKDSGGKKKSNRVGYV